MSGEAVNVIAQDYLASFATDRLLTRSTTLYPDFSLDDGYAVAHLIRDLRRERGETVVGRKIGGTNPATYHLTGATGPVWNFMFDSTVRELPDGEGTFAIGKFRQSKIEPELVLHICETPQPGMDEAELLQCVDRVAPAFEIVFSPFSDWKVRPADATAAFGLHQAALIGPWCEIASNRAGWGELLKSFEVTLSNDRGDKRVGIGSNVLGSPIFALKAIVDDIARHPDWTAVSVGEVVTTGTITELMPILPGETWTTTISGAPLSGLRLRLVS